MNQLVCPDCKAALFVTRAEVPGEEVSYKVECLKCGYRRGVDREEIGL